VEKAEGKVLVRRDLKGRPRRMHPVYDKFRSSEMTNKNGLGKGRNAQKGGGLLEELLKRPIQFAANRREDAHPPGQVGSSRIKVFQKKDGGKRPDSGLLRKRAGQLSSNSLHGKH